MDSCVERLLRHPLGLPLEVATGLLVATAVSDALSAAGTSFYLLVAGVPITAIAGLVCLGQAVDAANGCRSSLRARVQAGLLGLLVAAIVLGAAAREPTIAEGTVPLEASVALGIGLVLLAVQAALALLPAPLRSQRAA